MEIIKIILASSLEIFQYFNFKMHHLSLNQQAGRDRTIGHNINCTAFFYNRIGERQ